MHGQSAIRGRKRQGALTPGAFGKSLSVESRSNAFYASVCMRISTYTLLHLTVRENRRQGGLAVRGTYGYVRGTGSWVGSVRRKSDRNLHANPLLLGENIESMREASAREQDP